LIFTTFSYFLILVPAALLFRAAGPSVRPWVLVVSGVAFFVYFSVTEFAGWVGAACVAIFIWEALISRLYSPRSRWCLFGVAASLAILRALYVNDARVDRFSADFIQRVAATPERIPAQVPPGHYFVMGEQRSNQDISEYWGQHSEISLQATR
jgi:hypothetical protein